MEAPVPALWDTGKPPRRVDRPSVQNYGANRPPKEWMSSSRGPGRRGQLAARIVNGPDALTNHRAAAQAYHTKRPRSLAKKTRDRGRSIHFGPLDAKSRAGTSCC